MSTSLLSHYCILLCSLGKKKYFCPVGSIQYNHPLKPQFWHYAKVLYFLHSHAYPHRHFLLSYKKNAAKATKINFLCYYKEYFLITECIIYRYIYKLVLYSLQKWYWVLFQQHHHHHYSTHVNSRQTLWFLKGTDWLHSAQYTS